MLDDGPEVKFSLLLKGKPDNLGKLLDGSCVLSVTVL